MVSVAAAQAVKFSVDGVFYRTSGTTASVTYDNDNGQPYRDQKLRTVTIPPTVSYNGTTYTVTAIGDYAFYHCDSLETVTLPTTLTKIGINSFCYCGALKSITFPESLTSLGMWAFQSSGLTELHLPKNLTTIGLDAFQGCRLEYITVDPANTKYDSRGGCNAMIITASNYLLRGSNHTLIPNDVVTIGSQAFAWCERLALETLPPSVTSVRDYAFVGCDAITSFTFPESVTQLYSNVFQYCDNLESVYIPASVTTIKSSGFGGISLFRYCPKLRSVVVDEANPAYDSREGCNAIIETATGVLIEGSPASFIPEGVTYIGEDAFYGKDPLSELHIPSTVIGINNAGIYASDSLRSLTFAEPAALRYIGTLSLSYNRAIEVLELPEGLDSIARAAVQYCYNLRRIVLPSTVRYLGDNTFKDCNKLQAFYSKVNDPDAIIYGDDSGKCIASATFENATLFVPKGTAERYRAIDHWQVFPTIREIDYDNLRGDLNGDYEVNTGDISILYSAILNGDTSSFYDLNGDGSVNTGDISALYSIILGN